MSYGVTREEIERTIYRNLVEIAANNGYAVDTLGKTKPVVEAERAAVKSAKGGIVDLFSIGTTQQRGLKGNNGIYVNLRQFNAGSVAHWEDTEIRQDPNDPNIYSQVQVTEGMRNLLYDVRSVTSGSQFDRVCGDIIYGGLCQTFVGRYIPVVLDDYVTRDPERRILVQFSGSQEIKSSDFLERLYTFTVMDVWLKGEFGFFGDTTVYNGIVPLTKVCANKVDENGDIETQLLDIDES